MDCYSFVLSMKTVDLLEFLEIFNKKKYIFRFSNLEKKLPWYSSKTKKVIGKFKNETTDKLTKNELAALGAMTCSCTRDRLENKTKVMVIKDENKPEVFQKKL